MSRCASVVLTAASIAGAAFAQDQRPANPTTGERQTPARASLRGVWKVTELLSRAPGEGWVPVTPYSSLYIFTETHYSYMFATGAGPRRLFAGDPTRPTDAEKVAAYDSFVAASGTYVLSGPTLTLRATLHKNPNEMTGTPLTYTVKMEGDTLRMTIANPPFAPGRERRTTLARVE
jgi:hypothetical protein